MTLISESLNTVSHTDLKTYDRCVTPLHFQFTKESMNVEDCLKLYPTSCWIMFAIGVTEDLTERDPG